MRLTHIKLAGFKSFVDPVSFQLPGQLVAVVGPNGCGKSNIMDATRWVLGESRASELRGESMSDVIFNGSSNRKPAARASVELVFDNAEGRAGGQWGQYAEIAVRRVLTRDGGSSYYINNQQVRRRDVQDIFMGTGLGPRAYAIIGQGMISRIIEAKPEELRVFLEEAAGVSKYKERRRETENRLNDTRDNLTRVEDILRELNNQVEKLDAQAKVAQEYRDLQNSAQDKLHFLWVLRYDEAQAERDKINANIQLAHNELEAQMAKLRHIEAELESKRSQHYEFSDALNLAQASMYEANAEVSRIETELRFMTEGRARIQAQIEQIKVQIASWQERQSSLSDDMAQLTAEREAAQEEQAIFAEQLAQASENLPDLESQHRNAMQTMHDARAQLVQAEQSVARAADDQRNADRQLSALTLRRERLMQEKLAPGAQDAKEHHQLDMQLADELARQETAQAALDEVDAALPDAQQALQQARETAQAEHARIAQLSARLEALVSLQEKVQTEGKLGDWLDKYQLSTRQRVWQKLHIESGWENALEAVLAERMNGFEMSRIESAKNYFSDIPPARLSFYANVPSTSNVATTTGLRSLLQLIKTNDATLGQLLPDWLRHVYVANTLNDAYALREQLIEGAVLVTPEGHQLTRNSVRFYVAESEQAGMLARAQEIEHIEAQLRAQDMLVDSAQSGLSQLQAQVERLTAQHNSARMQLQSTTARVHELKMQVQKLDLEREQRAARHAQIDDEIAEITVAEEELQAQKFEAQALFDEGDAILVTRQDAWQAAQDAFETFERQLADKRASLRELEHQNRDAQYRVQTLTQRLADIEYNQQSSEQQLEVLQNSLEEQTIALEEFEQVNHHEGLQAALAVRVAREQALSTARIALDTLTHELRTMDEQRIAAERELEPKREAITQLQMSEQAARINQEQFETQLNEAQADINELRERLRETLSDTARASSLQAEITRLNNQINALGAVNLAALDELQVAQERQSFLNAQSADLTEAMNTLEDAIRKIDKESREMLMDTYNQVNKNFGELFPELFGGGEAKLVLTGEEILDAGVQVMAQPPGKRNSTIHLLSGGEKALTATALVFALFRLNPAPFCLLDEVDAPLDDANTDRFAQLVAKMSQQTQFLFISHNKITMEIADQLVGVTMQEQGVSRIVAVDMESALKLQQSNEVIAV